MIKAQFFKVTPRGSPQFAILVYFNLLRISWVELMFSDLQEVNSKI